MDPEKFREVAQTRKLTIIIRKDKQTQAPCVSAIYPGESKPAFPAKYADIDVLPTLRGSEASQYWESHAFIRPKE
jgi:hypothetical protein